MSHPPQNGQPTQPISPSPTQEAATFARLRAQAATQRAKRRGQWQKLYAAANSLFHLHPGDFVAVLRLIAKWTVLGGIVGVLAGTASAIFLTSLAWATQTRLAYPWLLWLLPLAGLLMGWTYHRFGGAAAQGNNLVIDEVNRDRSRIPLRMAPLVLLGTVITHLFGGSAGREGTAIQMGASLADNVWRWLRVAPADRRMTIMAGISGGFGSVFGVPVAGAVFGLEVQSVGRIHYTGLVPCLVAATVGDLVTRAWGVPHAHYPQFAPVAIEPWLLLKVVIAGVAFGVTSLTFVELTHGIKRLMTLLTRWTPLNPLIGGFVIIALTLLVGTRDYLGLSLPLIERTMDGTGVVTFAFLLKLIFTAVTLGTGYLGGEVTPLFVIGSTLGYTLGTLLGIDPALLAAIGLVAVFAGASNTPLACTIMGIELFGGGITLYLFLGCAVAYLASGHRGIYGTQMVGVPKIPHVDVLENENLHALIARRQKGWLPALDRFSANVLQKPVSALMAAPVVTVQEDAPVTQLIERAMASGVRTLPIVDRQQRVVGIVTDRDLARSGLKVSLTLLRQMTPQERADVMVVLGESSVGDLMTHPASTIATTATLQAAATLFTQHGFKRVPVVDSQGKLVGMITRSDLLREMAFANGGDGAALAEKQVQVCEVELLPAITVDESAPLADALAMMRRGGQSRLVVTDDAGVVKGIVTMTDLWAHIPAAQRPALIAALVGETEVDRTQFAQRIGEIMTSPITTISPDNSVAEALRLLLENRVKRLPVVDAQGRVLGLVGRAELLRLYAAVPPAD